MNKTTKMKKRILGVSLIVLCLAILATGTYAYFVAEETAYNVITTGYLHMDLVEEDENGKPWPVDGVSGIVPGMDVDKIAYVTNRGGVPFFTRILVEKKITPAQGVTAAMNPDLVHLDINTEDWTEQDGLYYYNRILKPGEKTEPLFTKATFDPAMGNEYMNATVEIRVLAQAVQSDNNGIDPLYAMGWSEAVQELIVDTQNID